MIRISTAGDICLYCADAPIPLTPPEKLVLAAGVIACHQLGQARGEFPFYAEVANLFFEGSPSYVRRHAKTILSKLGLPGGSEQFWRLANLADVNLGEGIRGPVLTRLIQPSVDSAEYYAAVLSARDYLNAELVPNSEPKPLAILRAHRLLAGNEKITASEVCIRRLRETRQLLKETLLTIPSVVNRADFLLERARLQQQELWFSLEEASPNQRRIERLYASSASDFKRVIKRPDSEEQESKAKKQFWILQYTYAVARRQVAKPLSLRKLRDCLNTEQQLGVQFAILDWWNEIGHYYLAAKRPRRALRIFMLLVSRRESLEEKAVALFNVALALAECGKPDCSLLIGGVANRMQEELEVRRTSHDIVEYRNWEVTTGKGEVPEWDELYEKMSWDEAIRFCRGSYKNAPAPRYHS